MGYSIPSESQRFATPKLETTMPARTQYWLKNLQVVLFVLILHLQYCQAFFQTTTDEIKRLCSLSHRRQQQKASKNLLPSFFCYRRGQHRK